MINLYLAFNRTPRIQERQKLQVLSPYGKYYNKPSFEVRKWQQTINRWRCIQ